jgi:hypothetical protein
VAGPAGGGTKPPRTEASFFYDFFYFLGINRGVYDDEIFSGDKSSCIMIRSR